MDITSYIKSKLDEFRNTVTSGYNAISQAPATLSGLGNRISSNFNWAGQQAQQNIVQPAQNFFQKNVVEAPAINLPQTPIRDLSSLAYNVARPVINIPLTFATGTAQDAIQNVQNYTNGKSPISYGQTRSPATRLGYQASSFMNMTPPTGTNTGAFDIANNALDFAGAAASPAISATKYAGAGLFGGVMGAANAVRSGGNILEGARTGAEDMIAQTPKFELVFGAVNKVLGPAFQKLAPSQQRGLISFIDEYDKVKNYASPETLRAIVNKGVQTFGRNMTVKALEGLIGMGTLGALEDAKTPQDRVKNILTQGATGAGMSLGMGLGAEALPLIGKYGPKISGKGADLYKNGLYGNGESGMVGNPRVIHPEDYTLYDSANTVLHEKKKFGAKEIAKATEDVRLLGEKYLHVADLPESGDPMLILNRLTKRMTSGALPTSGNVGTVDLNAKVDTGIFKSPYGRGDIGKIQAELENMLGVPSDAGFKQKQSILGQNYAILQQAADAGAPGAPEAVARAKELFSAIELAKKGQKAGIEAKLNEPIGQIDRTKLTGRQLSVTNEKLKRAYPKGNIEERFPVREGVPLTEKDANKQIDMISEAITKKYKARNVGQDELDLLAQTPDSQITGRIPVSKPTPDESDFIKSLEQDSRGVFVKSDAKGRVGLLDYFRTPDNVLKKIGLEPESNRLRQAWDGYKSDLKTEIDKISEWQKGVPDSRSSQAIFDYLDGQKVELAPNEKKVAEEIRSYLADWAVKLNLPKDKQVSSYITHLFDNDIAAKAQPPELAGIVMDQVPGSVYNPFLTQRIGAKGYVHDVWRALDAYAKRATRKYNMDPALDALKGASEKLDQSSYNYVKNYASRINMRPTDIDSLIDNTFKNIPVVGNMFGSRPVTTVTQRARQWAYRAALGFNPSSALRNLTQVSNTYAKLGEKYTASGYFRMMKELSTNGLQELKDVGVLDDAFITDRKFNAVKSLWERFDSAAFSMFDLAEKINRGGAYYGAKAKALAQGMGEQKAIDFAKKVVRDTQFQFGSIDTPLALSSDLAKTAGQFMSYPIKQTEFLAGMLKKKDVLGVARYVGATMVLMSTVGKLWGMKATDAIPFAENIKGLVTGGEQGQLPNPPIASYVQGLAALPNALNATDNVVKEDAQKKVGNAAKLLVPGGVAASRAIQGLNALQKGYSKSSTGNRQYDVQSDPVSAARTLIFGKNTLPQAQDYYDKTSAYFDNKNQIMSTLNDQERKAFDSLPKYDVNNPSSYDKEDSRLRYAIFANNPKVFEAKKAIELASAKQNGTPLDPIYLLSGDEARAVFTFYQASPGSQERRDLKAQYPIINSFLDARTKYFNDKDMQAIQDQYSKGQITQEQASAATQALNDKIASFASGGSKKPKKIASSRVRKVRFSKAKVKIGKFKMFKFPKLAKLKKYKVKKLTARA